mmetsp:Transcript_611/g.1484  ORF Transcript_611/g.1484 Transcript_611/m.1484 type:complete len:312 (-) Transcript_611:209-1144(-)
MCERAVRIANGGAGGSKRRMGRMRSCGHSPPGAPWPKAAPYGRAGTFVCWRGRPACRAARTGDEGDAEPHVKGPLIQAQHGLQCRRGRVELPRVLPGAIVRLLPIPHVLELRHVGQHRLVDVKHEHVGGIGRRQAAQHVQCVLRHGLHVRFVLPLGEVRFDRRVAVRRCQSILLWESGSFHVAAADGEEAVGRKLPAARPGDGEHEHEHAQHGDHRGVEGLPQARPGEGVEPRAAAPPARRPTRRRQQRRRGRHGESACAGMAGGIRQRTAPGEGRLLVRQRRVVGGCAAAGGHPDPAAAAERLTGRRVRA